MQLLIAFLLIIGLSFGIMAMTLTGMVGDYLYDEKLSQQRTGMEALTVRTAPLLATGDTAMLNSILAESVSQQGGRYLVTDSDGKVQLDTEGILNGQRLNHSEVAAVLARGSGMDYAVRDSESDRNMDLGSFLFQRSGADWHSFCSSAIVWENAVIGVLVQVTSADSMMRSLYQLRDRSLIIFMSIALAALIASALLSRIITRPMLRLTSEIRHMAKGDFSSRVEVKGSYEMRQLARAFNAMSEKVESLDQSRNQFVSNASHELKTPLATMKVLIQSLIYQPEMEQALRTEFLTDIDKEIDRLSAIVSDLLTLVKMDSGEIRINREDVSLAELCRETQRLLYPVAAPKHQTIQLELNDSCRMKGDRSKLTQVIYNLVENAVKYTQEGSQIRVELTRGGREALLVVADNGPGIPKDALPHIFDRFYRVDKARSRAGGGTGLGLSIVRQFVQLHGGEIRAESQEGKGSRFIVTLPLHQED